MTTGGATVEQKLALTFEVETGVRLVRIGLAELQSIDGANVFYQLPLLLLSNGFERLMKCMICLKRYEDTGGFPPTDEIKTHDLLDLKELILSECISEATALKRPATEDDYQYLRSDADLHILLEMLSQFGKFARYYNLDVVTGSAKPIVDIEQEWQDYELGVVGKHAELASLHGDPDRLDDFHGELNRVTVRRLERFARALARQFTLGDLGEEAKRLTPVVSHFLYLRDDELGNTDYRAKRNG